MGMCGVRFGRSQIAFYLPAQRGDVCYCMLSCCSFFVWAKHRQREAPGKPVLPNLSGAATNKMLKQKDMFDLWIRLLALLIPSKNNSLRFRVYLIVANYCWTFGVVGCLQFIALVLESYEFHSSHSSMSLPKVSHRWFLGMQGSTNSIEQVFVELCLF